MVLVIPGLWVWYPRATSMKKYENAFIHNCKLLWIRAFAKWLKCQCNQYSHSVSTSATGCLSLQLAMSVMEVWAAQALNGNLICCSVKSRLLEEKSAILGATELHYKKITHLFCHKLSRQTKHLRIILSLKSVFLFDSSLSWCGRQKMKERKKHHVDAH